MTDRLQLNFRIVDQTELNAFKAAAKRSGLTVSEWGRLVMRAAAGLDVPAGQPTLEQRVEDLEREIARLRGER